MTGVSLLDRSQSRREIFKDRPHVNPAAALLEIAAYRIDLNREVLANILDRCDEECIKEEWQLQYLESSDWKDLGAPLGLVAAIRSCIQEKTEPTSCACSTAGSSIDLQLFQIDDTPADITTPQSVQNQPLNPEFETEFPEPPLLKEAKTVPETYYIPINYNGRSSVPINFERQQSNPSLMKLSDHPRHSMPALPSRKKSFLVDDETFSRINPLDLDEGTNMVEREIDPAKEERCVTPPARPERRISKASTTRTSTRTSYASTFASLTLSELVEDLDY